MAIRRREFIVTLGAAAAWPLVTRAQQPAMPVIGFLNADSPQGYDRQLSAFLKGLGDNGYVDGRNVAVEYRWAGNRLDRLPAMAADLVHRQVTVIAATSTPAALAAKAATTNIPIVFETGGDPVQLGLVARLNQPGGNVTGVTQLNWEILPKRLELLHELLPSADVIALLINPTDTVYAETQLRQARAAAHMLGLDLRVLNASTEHDFDSVFADLTHLRAGGLVIGEDAFFTSHVKRRADGPSLSAGGLQIARVRCGRRSAGLRIGWCRRIRSGRRLYRSDSQRRQARQPAGPAATKIELYINLKTAKALGITVSLPLSGRADEVTE
jgi:putative tryptophan/tyrosine transport system substrate-binding protein